MISVVALLFFSGGHFLANRQFLSFLPIVPLDGTPIQFWMFKRWLCICACFVCTTKHLSAAGSWHNHLWNYLFIMFQFHCLLLLRPADIVRCFSYGFLIENGSSDNMIFRVKFETCRMKLNRKTVEKNFYFFVKKKKNEKRNEKLENNKRNGWMEWWRKEINRLVSFIFLQKIFLCVSVT